MGLIGCPKQSIFFCNRTLKWITFIHWLFEMYCKIYMNYIYAFIYCFIFFLEFIRLFAIHWLHSFTNQLMVQHIEMWRTPNAFTCSLDALIDRIHMYICKCIYDMYVVNFIQVYTKNIRSWFDMWALTSSLYWQRKLGSTLYSHRKLVYSPSEKPYLSLWSH